MWLLKELIGMHDFLRQFSVKGVAEGFNMFLQKTFSKCMHKVPEMNYQDFNIGIFQTSWDSRTCHNCQDYYE